MDCVLQSFLSHLIFSSKSDLQVSLRTIEVTENNPVLQHQVEELYLLQLQAKVHRESNP